MSLQFGTTFTPSGDISQFGPHQLLRMLDGFDGLHYHRRGRRSPDQPSFNPRFDIRESEDAFHLDGEIPGVAQKDIDIEFSDPQTLVIKGRVEREYHRTDPEATEESDKTESAVSAQKKKTDTQHFWASERTVGHFQRTISFPSRVNQDAVKATLKDGILSVVIPKAVNVPNKKILVE